MEKSQLFTSTMYRRKNSNFQKKFHLLYTRYSLRKFECQTIYDRYPENGRQNVECGLNEINASLIVSQLSTK